MLSEFYDSHLRIEKLRNGPAGQLIESFARTLSEAGYARITARRHLRAAEHFFYWIRRRGIAMRDADEQALAHFTNHLSRCRCPHYGHADQVGVTHGARLFVSHLRDIGTIAASVSQNREDPQLLVAFGLWMRQQRGTCHATLYNYNIHLRPLLSALEMSQADSTRLCCESLFWKSTARPGGQLPKSALRRSACSCASSLPIATARQDWKQPFPSWLIGA